MGIIFIYKWVKKTLGKGVIARYEQFLLSPHCFQKTCTADRLKQGLVWDRANGIHLIETMERTAEIVHKDQIARMSRLVLLFSLPAKLPRPGGSVVSVSHS